jgi:hypothetical protein
MSDVTGIHLDSGVVDIRYRARVPVLHRLGHLRRRMLFLICLLAVGVPAVGAYAYTYVTTYGGRDGSAVAASEGSVYASSDSEVEIPAAANMSAFSQPQSSGDRALSASSDVREEVARATADAPGVDEELLPGAEESHSLRALMTNLGSEGRSIWAIVTSKGRVCAGLTGFSSGCVGKFTSPEEHVSVTIGAPSASAPVIVWGLAPDDVARVDVVVAGRLKEAELGTNAFFYSLANPDLDMNAVQGLVVTLKDDSKPPIEIQFAPTPAPAID